MLEPGNGAESKTGGRRLTLSDAVSLRRSAGVRGHVSLIRRLRTTLADSARSIVGFKPERTLLVAVFQLPALFALTPASRYVKSISQA